MMTMGLTLEILEAGTNKSVFKEAISLGGLTSVFHIIFDLARTPNDAIFKNGVEYAVACGTLQGTIGHNNGALRFIKLHRDSSGSFLMTEDPDECYFKGKSVYCVKYVSKVTLVACMYKRAEFVVVDRL